MRHLKHLEITEADLFRIARKEAKHVIDELKRENEALTMDELYDLEQHGFKLDYDVCLDSLAKRFAKILAREYTIVPDSGDPEKLGYSGSYPRSGDQR